MVYRYKINVQQFITTKQLYTIFTTGNRRERERERERESCHFPDMRPDIILINLLKVHNLFCF